MVFEILSVALVLVLPTIIGIWLALYPQPHYKSKHDTQSTSVSVLAHHSAES